MKIIGLSLAWLFVVSTADAQINDTDRFIREVFTSLKHQDEQRYFQLFPAADQLKMILKNLMEQEPGNDSVKMKAANAVFETITDSILYAGYRKDFTRILDSAALAGIQWQDAQYVYHTADTTTSSEVDGKILSGLIIFTSSNKEYFIRYEGVIWFRNVGGWLGITLKQVGEMRYPD